MHGRFEEHDWEEARRALDGFGLEEIEIRVARLVSRGRTNTRIAGDLKLKPHKVKWIVRVLFIKLGVDDRHGVADVVGSRLDVLREREGRRRPQPRPERSAELRILKKSPRARRTKADPDGPDGEQRVARP